MAYPPQPPIWKTIAVFAAISVPALRGVGSILTTTARRAMIPRDRKSQLPSSAGCRNIPTAVQHDPRLF